MTNKECVLIGGDIRQKYIADILLKHGATVTSIGLERCDQMSTEVMITDKIPAESIIILPIPITKDGIKLFAPFSERNISLNALFDSFTKRNIVCGGLFPNYFVDKLKERNIDYFDYGRDPAFQYQNGLPSAEGAIELAMRHTPYILRNAKVCVIGYGNIGKHLVSLLIKMGCQVTATARKSTDLDDIRKTDAVPIETKDLDKAGRFDIVFNTVPALVVTNNVLQKQDSSTLIIDLASKPGGVDFVYADKQGIQCIQALSLPALYAPLTAAEITLDSIRTHLFSKEGN
ncbi:MAG: NAD(P)-binding domain-containing protein [Clostridia bacterium]|nr:NAD(P)-binding domain-containing protein [Clostridia bacterium]